MRARDAAASREDRSAAIVLTAVVLALLVSANLTVPQTAGGRVLGSVAETEAVSVTVLAPSVPLSELVPPAGLVRSPGGGTDGEGALEADSATPDDPALAVGPDPRDDAAALDSSAAAGATPSTTDATDATAQPAAPDAPTPPDAPVASESPPAAQATPAQATPAQATPAQAPSAEPTTVVIPRIGVSHRLIPVGLHPDRTLVVPDDGQVAGWYTGAPRPGQRGPAVVTGHNSWRGATGVFYRLHQLSAGDLIEVHHDEGSVVRFRVDRLEQHPKDRFPTQTVYGNTAGPELRVITCGGAFDTARGSHVDNVIVFATRVG
jgi:sortase (surface protein transpeptidase)